MAGAVGPDVVEVVMEEVTVAVGAVIADAEVVTVDAEVVIGEVDAKVTVEYGDFAEPLMRACAALAKVSQSSRPRNHQFRPSFQAKEYAANDHQKSAIDLYIES